MLVKTPFSNVHSSALLELASKLGHDGEALDVSELCALGVDLQTSLRASNADSERINQDPAYRLVMIALGERMGLGNFTDFSQAYDHMTQCLQAGGPLGQRARWADMAQGGAVNLTPMAKSLLAAVAQVQAEGGLPEADGCVRLIAHQMSFITQTTALTLADAETSNLRAWCCSAQATLAIERLSCPKQTPAP